MELRELTIWDKNSVTFYIKGKGVLHHKGLIAKNIQMKQPSYYAQPDGGRTILSPLKFEVDLSDGSTAVINADNVSGYRFYPEEFATKNQESEIE